MTARTCQASIPYGLSPDFALPCGRPVVNCRGCGEPTELCDRCHMEDEYGNPCCESCCKPVGVTA